MIYFLSKTQFEGPLDIYFGHNDSFEKWAPQIEEKVMIAYFGYKFWDAYKANPGNYAALHIKLTAMMAGFFYYYYQRDVQSFNTPAGEFASRVENSEHAPKALVAKMVQAWNASVGHYEGTADWVEDNPGGSPAEMDNDQVPKLQNTFGI